MADKKIYCVYIMTNFNNTVLYVGVTNNIRRRVDEHKQGTFEGFSKRYRLTKLVYYETFNEINRALFREKQIKAGSRKKKEELIKELNPVWEDLFDILF